MRCAWALHAPCSSFVESAFRACARFAEGIFAAIGIIPGFRAYPQPPGSMPVLKLASPEAAAFPLIGGKAVALAWSCSGPIRPGLRHSVCFAGIEIAASERFEPDAIVWAHEPKRYISCSGSGRPSHPERIYCKPRRRRSMPGEVERGRGGMRNSVVEPVSRFAASWVRILIQENPEMACQQAEGKFAIPRGAADP